MTKAEEEKRRRERNESLVHRTLAGEDTRLYKPSDTFFPPRPAIIKDEKALQLLFRGKEAEHEWSKPKKIPD